MEKILKKYILLSILIITSGCRSFVPFNGETYNPEKMCLSFLNESICVYTRYDIMNNQVYSDSCTWEYNTQNRIILKCFPKASLCESNDSIRKRLFNFIYDICPKWYNIKSDEFMSVPNSKYPLYQEKDVPYGYKTPSFYDKFGGKVSCDTCYTAIFIDPKCVAIRNTYFLPSFFFIDKTVKVKMPKAHSRMAKKMLKAFYPWLTNSYEYINYKVNYDRMLGLSLAIDSITGKQFSFIGDSCKKESLRFINDSVCEHVLSMRKDKSSQYAPFDIDTCHYTVKNNLIAIDLIPNKSCDTLSYGNGMLFYSKVYRDNDQYKHIVKPFIDEARSCANKTDSINMIMSTYFDVYVPLNFYK